MLTVEARRRTSISPGFGDGTGTCSTETTSGGPNRCATAARIVVTRVVTPGVA